MKRITTIALAALVLVAALAAVGCGGDGGGALSQEEYQQRLDQASTDLQEASSDLGSNLGDVIGGNEDAGSAAADSLGQVTEQLRQTAGELEDVDPPENAEQANEELVNALRAYAEDLDELREPLESGNLSDIQKRLGELEQLDSVEDLQQAAQNLQEAGYSFET